MQGSSPNEQKIQLLNFTLADNVYGIDITKVQEIRALGKVRSIPNIPTHCLGVIEFRQSMVPILDLRAFFGYPQIALSEQTVVIIVNLQDVDQLLGLVVDSVSDVSSVSLQQIKKSPKMNRAFDNPCVQGMFKNADKIILVLAIDKLLHDDTVEEIKQLFDQDLNV